MRYAKLENGELVILGPKVVVDGQVYDSDSDEAAGYRVANGFVELRDSGACPCPSGCVPELTGCHYDDDDDPAAVICDYAPVSIREAKPETLAKSVKNLDVSAMTSSEKSVVIQKLADFASKYVSIALAFVVLPLASALASFSRVPAGDLRDADLVVVDTPDWTQSETNEAGVAVGELGVAVGELGESVRGTTETSWYRSDDWAAKCELLTRPTEFTVISVNTNDVGCVYSNIVTDIAYSLSARLLTYSLDKFSMTPPPNVDWVLNFPQTAAISNGVITASVAGTYRVSAVSQDDPSNARTVDVPLSQRLGKDTYMGFYETDAEVEGSWVKETNDEWLEDVRNLWNDGQIRHRTYGSISYDYKFWKFGDGVEVLFKYSAHRFGRNLISPRVVAVASHYGDMCYSMAVTATYYDEDGNPHSITTGGGGRNSPFCWNLADWAKTHGWSEQAVKEMHIDDIAVLISKTGAACSPSSCPYFISRELWDAHYGNNGNGLCGWGSTQGYSFTTGDKRKDAYPVVIRCDARSGFVWGGAGYMDTDGYWKTSTTRESAVPMFRRDAREYFDSFGDNASYWMFPPIYTGDSGTPIFIKRDGKLVLLSQHTSVAGGPNFVNALPVLRKFCDEQVRETLNVEVGDTLKEITE